MRATVRGLLILSLLFLSACSTLRNKSSDGADLDRTGPGLRESEASSEDVERNVERPYQSSYGEIALDYNPYVEKWLNYFQGKGRDYMQTYLERSGRYLPMMKNVLRENGLPEDLVYIALIESGFSPRAHSHANAVGYWQFIRGTGKRFGLNIDTFIDERRDPVLSTRAAAQYFKALYDLLGSWHLALAAYNVGEYRVKRAVTRHYTKDYWELIKKRRSLPVETKNYVPKFIAATLIAKDPAKYGFSEVQYADPLSYDTVSLQQPISLTKLAAHLNVETEELQLLNPKFRTDFVPITRGDETIVRIPVGRANDALAALSLSVSSQPPIVRAEYFFYRIRRGDNLSTIARRHRTTVSQLRRLNNLSNRSVLRVGRKLKVPDNGGDGIRYVTEDAGASASHVVPAVEKRESLFHTVRRGENLSTIADRYNVSMEELLRLNNLTSRSVIRKGQKIRVRPEPESTSNAKTQGKVKMRPVALASFKSRSRTQKMTQELKRSHVAAASSGVRPVGRSGAHKHTVRRGETLYDLSKKYGISLSALAQANDVKVNYRVMAGEKLVIPH